MTRLIGIYGVGGCARGIFPLKRAEVRGTDARVLFINDNPGVREVNGVGVTTWSEFLAEPASDKSVCLAIANSRVREQLADRCDEAGIPIAAARASNVLEMDDVTLGEGALLSPFVTLTSNIRIGRCFHANLYSYVEHDCVIGDFVTFAPRVSCNGNVHIDDHAYIGTGAVIRQGTLDKPLRIGRCAIVGMGAVVTKDVPDGITVIGNPARPMTRKSNAD